MGESAIRHPVISVIVPLYNCEAYIGECIRSLQNQTFDDWEAIVVDDGSTDGSAESADCLTKGDRRFTVLRHDRNRGQSAARNTALERCKGEYLVLLDSDDYLVPVALESIADRMGRQDLDDLYFSARSFYESKQAHQLVREDYSVRPPFEGVATGMELFTYFEERDAFFPQAPLRAVKTSLVRQNHIRFYEGIIHEDLLFTLQTLLVSQRSSFLDEELYMRRVRMGSTMAQTRRTPANVNGHFVCMNFMSEWMRQHADDLDRAFIGAMTHRMADYRNMMARDWFVDLTEEERRGYLSSLSNGQLLEFLQTVVEPGSYVDELYHSKTYRLGDALASGPRALRNFVSERLSYRNDTQ